MPQNQDYEYYAYLINKLNIRQVFKKSALSRGLVDYRKITFNGVGESSLDYFIARCTLQKTCHNESTTTTALPRSPCKTKNPSAFSAFTLYTPSTIKGIFFWVLIRRKICSLATEY